MELFSGPGDRFEYPLVRDDGQIFGPPLFIPWIVRIRIGLFEDMADTPGAYYIPLAVVKPLPSSNYAQEGGKIFANARLFRYEQRYSHLELF